MPSKTKRNLQENEQDSQQLPNNWPSDITYLTDLTYSPAVTPELRAALSRSNASDSTVLEKVPPELIRYPCSTVAITIISNEKHPARGQRGLFAAQTLPPDSFICLYLGHAHTNSMSDQDPHSDYDLSFDGDTGLSIDSARSGNESRCANDYRGIAERPNAEFRDCFIQVRSDKRVDGVKWERRVGIFVLSAGKAQKRKAGIKPGEEVVVSYGKGFWESRKLMATFRKDFEMLRIANAALNA